MNIKKIAARKISSLKRGAFKSSQKQAIFGTSNKCVHLCAKTHSIPPLFKVIKELESLKDDEQAINLQRFFKTGKGEYGEGDVFLGIKVPVQRKVAKKHNLSLDELQSMLNSRVHEHRLTALFILIRKYEKENNKDEIAEFYLKNTRNINNWDLVDLSAPRIIGEHLFGKDKSVLYKLAKSDILWERRIAIISTASFIKRGSFDDTLKISKMLLNDKHDLIHKAVGWMLREVGKKNQDVEEGFLKENCSKMPRTMLRYAIEKFDEKKRKNYLKNS